MKCNKLIIEWEQKRVEKERERTRENRERGRATNVQRSVNRQTYRFYLCTKTSFDSKHYEMLYHLHYNVLFSIRIVVHFPFFAPPLCIKTSSIVQAMIYHFFLRAPTSLPPFHLAECVCECVCVCIVYTYITCYKC